ncbi:MAG TPA: hypothetical protein VFM46_01125, partial [Pseudomonadales bacterium]|nr:hypothetical protein [Pseudomonadales bacterium]
LQSPIYFPFNPDARGVAHKPWLEAPFDKLGVTLRSFRGQAVLGHESIEARMAAGAVMHAPFETPRRYKPANWTVTDVVKQINSVELLWPNR